jgi:hypothetical protein
MDDGAFDSTANRTPARTTSSINTRTSTGVVEPDQLRDQVGLGGGGSGVGGDSGPEGRRIGLLVVLAAMRPVGRQQLFGGGTEQPGQVGNGLGPLEHHIAEVEHQPVDHAWAYCQVGSGRRAGRSPRIRVRAGQAMTMLRESYPLAPFGSTSRT